MITLTFHFPLRYFPSGEGNSRMRISFKYTYYEKDELQARFYLHMQFFIKEKIFIMTLKAIIYNLIHHSEDVYI